MLSSRTRGGDMGRLGLVCALALWASGVGGGHSGAIDLRGHGGGPAPRVPPDRHDQPARKRVEVRSLLQGDPREGRNPGRDRRVRAGTGQPPGDLEGNGALRPLSDRQPHGRRPRRRVPLERLSLLGRREERVDLRARRRGHEIRGDRPARRVHPPEARERPTSPRRLLPGHGRRGGGFHRGRAGALPRGLRRASAGPRSTRSWRGARTVSTPMGSPSTSASAPP